MKIHLEWLVNELKISQVRFENESSILNLMRMIFLERLLSYSSSHEVLDKPLTKSDVKDIQVLSYLIFDDLHSKHDLLRHAAVQILSFLTKLPGYSEQTARLGEIPVKASDAYSELIQYLVFEIGN